VFRVVVFGLVRHVEYYHGQAPSPKLILLAGIFLPIPLGESQMTEPMIEQTEAEEFADELSDEALDREPCRDFFCTKTVQCRADIVVIGVPLADR
jgi:hypothetical protein